LILNAHRSENIGTRKGGKETRAGMKTSDALFTVEKIEDKVSLEELGKRFKNEVLELV
jgi:hypothetical protein